MSIRNKLLMNLAISVFVYTLSSQAWAIPNLQIYIPGATYEDETWVIHSYDYQLWVVGAHLFVDDVKLAFAVPEGETGAIEVTWLDTKDLDPSVVPPGEDPKQLDPGKSDYGYPAYDEVVSLMLKQVGALDIDYYRASYGFLQDGPGIPDPATYGFEENATPLMGDGKPIPPHGVFPTDYYEYFIGDFDTIETVYNYIPGDEEGDTARGQIKAFDISVKGYTWVDIIAYDHVILGKNKARYLFSPLSHDGGSGTPIPEPSTILLLCAGIFGLIAVRRKYRSL